MQPAISLKMYLVYKILKISTMLKYKTPFLSCRQGIISISEREMPDRTNFIAMCRAYFKTLTYQQFVTNQILKVTKAFHFDSYAMPNIKYQR